MNVLHIGNTAAIAGTLRDNFRNDGIPSDIMTFYPDILDQGSDFPHPYPKWVRINPPLYGALRMYHMLKKAGDYDILHFHAFGGITFHLDYPLWRALGKKVILHYHGTELRRFGRESPFARLAHKRYVSTPDLLPLAPGATWFPVPLPIPAHPYVGLAAKDPEEPLIVLNAAASEAHGITHKGLDIIRAAVRRVQRDHQEIEFQSLISVPYVEALRQYQQADIIVGQTHIGWYGLFELECMLMGKPVITYVDPAVAALVPHLGTVPVAPISRDDADSLARQILTLAADPGLRIRLGQEGRAYAKHWHDADQIIPALERDYAEIMAMAGPTRTKGVTT
jgi:hypothetical protein